MKVPPFTGYDSLGLPRFGTPLRCKCDQADVTWGDAVGGGYVHGALHCYAIRGRR